MPPSAADRANQDLVDRLIAQGALWSPRLIAAFRATPRHRFLERVFHYSRKQGLWREVPTQEPGPEELRLIYSDRALITRLSRPTPGAAETPISSSSQPSLMAQMLEDLALAPGRSVLEIGAGTGYNAALLAHVAGPGLVTAVDVDKAVLAEARAHLRAFPERLIELRHADGRAPLAGDGPFDRILVTAATPDLEPAWLDQLADAGRLMAPLALAPGLAYVVCGGVRGGVFEGRLTRAAYFMPLRAADEPGAADADGPPVAGRLRPLRAPWAGWIDRGRPRSAWPGLVQALAFFGWLRGLTVGYQALPDGGPAWGLSEPGCAAVCWVGERHWYVSGSAGRDLGGGLWRAFLDAGGPWPTEFQLRARPGGAPPGGGAFVRRGPCCTWAWRLIEGRERPAWP